MGKIDAFFDCPSPYSYFAFIHLLRNRARLAEYGVQVDFHPIFLGGVNVGSGNTPPWTNPVKARYNAYDRTRAAKAFNLPNPNPPPFFPPLTLLPQRAALYIKANYSRARFERIWARYWRYMFFDHIDISKPEGLARLLADDGAGDAPEVRAVFVNDLDSAHANQSPLGDNGGGACSPQEVRAILEAAASPQYKKALTEATAGVLEMGAYGAPWFWVVPDRKTEGDQAEGQAEGEPFFGSDRFGHMWRFLGVPFRDTEIVPKL